MDKKTIGLFGEDLADNYLTKKGYQIIARNYRIGHLEIDLIASKSNHYFLFEIKTRSNKLATLSSPINQQQQKRLKKAAVLYAASNNLNFDLIHFDLLLIIVERENKKIIIKHYADIF
ncbi:YraN family protein [Candidatus Falkowbacteria bacterium]|nr:YraN family protein [Candidatus Falkowbacteria bacterium]